MEMSGNGKESSLPPVLPEEEDLPPGVRKHNRCHSSSSSESEDEVDKTKQQTIDVDSSDSDSDAPKQDDKKADNSEQVAADAKSGSKEKEISSKAGRSRSRSESRSKSRSHSPSPKRRKSSEKSKRSRSRSRDRDRRHRRDRKHRSHRSRSKERRRSRDRHRHKKDRRRSRSRSRSRDRERRDRRNRRSSRDKDRRRRSRSRDRRDSRSPSPHDGKVIKFGNKVIKPGASFGRPTSSSSSKPITFKEKMRQQLIKAIEEGADTNDVLVHKGGSTICTQSAGVLQQTVPKPKGPPVPLMDTIVPSTAASLAALTVTASQAAMQSMLALQKEATEKTGVEIPKYYNPAAINPMKYAEQVQKRKLLWSKAKDKDVNSQWHATSLSGDADDKSKEKFRKLMGIKNDSTGDKEGEKEEKQKQLFDQLNKEYEFARMTTHTHRGIGLGFGSSSAYPPQQLQQQAPPSSLPPHSQQPPPSTS